MSLNPESRKKILRLRRHLDEYQPRDVDPQRAVHDNLKLLAQMLSSIPIDSETVEGSRTSEDINVLSKRQHDLTRRVISLEQKLNMQTFDKIEDRIKIAFSNTPIIEKVYVQFEQSSLPLIIVYNSMSVADAIVQIQPRLAKLEDEFPDVYFDPHIFHVNDIREEHYQQSKLIFSR